VIAGSDPSGGAGLELALKVHALFGVHAAAIATCHTTQTADGLVAVEAADRRRAGRQHALLRAVTPWCVLQVGMVNDRAWIELLSRWIDRDKAVPVVIDPVVTPTRGRRTLPSQLLGCYRELLLPRATLLTPNADEAAELLGWPRRRVSSEPDAAVAALQAMGAKAVLLKGGHLLREGPVVDRLRGPFKSLRFRKPRQRGASPRGTGCALAAAITARLARGDSIGAAVNAAESWIGAARSASQRLGKGRPYLSLTAPRAV
jgi:hydroxymethylpyrimidine/phosphomethylpyrimidine kinase